MADETLLTLAVADAADAWRALGFALEGDTCRIGDVALRFLGAGDVTGIAAWSVPDLGEGIDTCAAATVAHLQPHANGVTTMDHLVMMTPDGDRTTAALVAAGHELRRVRRFDQGSRTVRQSFFWVGSTILEVVADDAVAGVGPATLWGLAVSCDDLDATAAYLGDRVSGPKDAVQRGRRIASLRADVAGVTVPLAFMSPHVSGS